MVARWYGGHGEDRGGVRASAVVKVPRLLLRPEGRNPEPSLAAAVPATSDSVRRRECPDAPSLAPPDGHNDQGAGKNPHFPAPFAMPTAEVRMRRRRSTLKAWHTPHSPRMS
ncbi:hypothetical protein SSP24_12500 [Streptomyces spinoverrucosus]|uniref:Uncharacterized protein n=1 Tax=Streptomyces spinoverrucosus TaxID=284043 RepID=A0A4Y3VBA1_9ACTN|nr:hypothetical protein SSP24_12500 [Streptomyces spinoverrucosus]GHB34644.1 hypothetical protein GCM10010397_00060 [Streptomyces spinoverrucosus]